MKGKYVLLMLLAALCGTLARGQEADTSRWSFGVSTGVEATWGSLLPGGYTLQGRTPRNLAPRRVSVASTVDFVARYRAGDRLWIWGALSHAGGSAFGMPLDVTAISGGFAYALSESSLLEMHFHFVHDQYGSMLYPPYGHTWYGPLTPSYELYHGPWPF